METHLFKKNLPYFTKSNGNSFDMFILTALHNSVSSCSGHSQVLEPQFSCEIAEYHLPEVPHVWPLPPMTNLPLIETRLMSAFGASHYAEPFCKGIYTRCLSTQCRPFTLLLFYSFILHINHSYLFLTMKEQLGTP